MKNFAATIKNKLSMTQALLISGFVSGFVTEAIGEIYYHLPFSVARGAFIILFCMGLTYALSRIIIMVQAFMQGADKAETRTSEIEDVAGSQPVSTPSAVATPAENSMVIKGQ